MTAKGAYENAKKMIAEGIKMIGCLELPDSYAFFTNAIGHDEIVPDGLTVQVFKDTGETTYMENDQPYFDEKKQAWIDPLENAKEIDISELR